MRCRHLAIIILFISAGLVTNITPVFAQKPTKLNDVVKFEFTTIAGGMSSWYKVIDVIRTGDTWKVYQIKSRKGDEIDTIKKYIRNIHTNTLAQLLNIINKADTNININLFKIDKNELTRYIDTVAHGLKPLQKLNL